MKHLIIPDAHAHPNYSNDRFTALGNFIIEERPDVIICIGDLADMPSLSSYDKGTKGFEGRRYDKDIDVTIDAQERLFSPIDKHNARRNQYKKIQYKPKRVMCMGNHEDRIARAVNAQPELDGKVGLKDLKYQNHWDTVIPFKEAITLHGIAYSHYFSSGTMGSAISGEHIGASLIKKNHMSSVQGHSHLFDHSERTRPDTIKLFGMSCGCYVHPDYVEGWNKNTAHMWWRGVVILEGVSKGYYEEMRPVIQTKILREYL